MAAALAALNGEAAGVPKSRDGAVESIRMLRVARCDAVKARTPGGQPAARPDSHRTRASAPATGQAATPAASGSRGAVPPLDLASPCEGAKAALASVGRRSPSADR